MSKEKAIKISLLGSYSGNNKGDLAIVCAIVENLIRLLPQIKIYIPSMQPWELKKHVPKSENVTVYQSITHYLGPLNFWYFGKSDCLVYGGGGLFFDRKLFNPFYGHLINLFILTLLNKIFFKKPIYLFSVGVSKLNNPLARLTTKFILKNADYISARDKRTVKIFSELTDRKIHLRYDPTFLLNPVQSKRIDRLYEGLTQEETVLICLNSAAIRNVRGVLKLIENFSEKNYNVILYQNHCRQNITKFFWKRLGSRKNVHLLKPLANSYSPEEILYLFKKADYGISFPMHSGIFAFLAGKPVALVNYDPKVTELGKIIQNQLIVEPSEIEQLGIKQIKSQGNSQANLAEIRENIVTGFENLKDFLTKEVRCQ